MGSDPVVLTGQALAAAPGRRFDSHRTPRALRSAGAALACIAAIAVILLEPRVAAVAKALADPFFHSTSSGAAIALLAMLAVAAVVASMPQRIVNRDADSQQTLRAGGVLIAGALLGTLANLLAHVMHLQALDLPVTVPVYHWSGDSNTYSYLFHSHAGKAALGAMFGDLARVWAPTYDLGGGLGPAQPGWVAPVCMATAIAAAGATVVLLRATLRRYRSRWIAALLLFCAFNAIKSIFDGGPLTYRFVPAVWALVLLIAHAASASRRQLSWLAGGAVATLFGYGVLWSALGLPSGSEALSGLATTVAVIVWLAAGGARDLPTLLRRGLQWASGGVVAATVLASLLETPVALALPLAEGTRATSCELGTRACTHRSAAGESAFEVYRLSGDDPLKPRRTFIWHESDAGRNDWVVVLRPIAFASRRVAAAGAAGPALHATPLRALPEAASTLVSLQSDTLPRLFGSEPGPFTSHNYYVFLHLAAAELRAQGLGEFALVTLRDARDAQRIGLR